MHFDEDVVIEELNILTIDLEPKNGDHTKNFDILIDRIGNQNSEMTAEMGCYVCIETAPPQSVPLMPTSVPAFDGFPPGNQRLKARNS